MVIVVVGLVSDVWMIAKTGPVVGFVVFCGYGNGIARRCIGWPRFNGGADRLLASMHASPRVCGRGIVRHLIGRRHVGPRSEYFRDAGPPWTAKLMMQDEQDRHSRGKHRKIKRKPPIAMGVRVVAGAVSVRRSAGNASPERTDRSSESAARIGRRDARRNPPPTVPTQSGRVAGDLGHAGPAQDATNVMRSATQHVGLVAGPIVGIIDRRVRVFALGLR